MAQKKKTDRTSPGTLPKAPTGIPGLDRVTLGGLLRGRPTLSCGGAGAGKTLFGLEFVVRGATQFSEPGGFISLEESIEDLSKNAASLGFELDRLVADKKLFVDYVQIERSEIAETGRV
jgi:circadian clock protein KaiC